MEHELLESKATKTRRKNDADVPGQEQTQPVTSVQRILQLQRTIGNRAVGRRIRKKLEAIDPGDPYERKGDRGAEQVMRSLGLRIQPSVQRKALSEEDEDKENQPVQMTPFAVSIAPMVQRQMIPDEEKDEKPVQMEAVVQRSAHEGSFEAVRQPQIEVAGGSESHEIEADRAADQVAQGRSTRGAAAPRPSTPSVPTSGVPGLGSGIPMSPDLRHRLRGRLRLELRLACACTRDGPLPRRQRGWVRAPSHAAATSSSAVRSRTRRLRRTSARSRTSWRTWSSRTRAPRAGVQATPTRHRSVDAIGRRSWVSAGVTSPPSATSCGRGARRSPALAWTDQSGGAVPAGVTIIGSRSGACAFTLRPAAA